MLEDIMEGADIDGDEEFDYKKHVNMIADTVLQINDTTIKVRTLDSKLIQNLFSHNFLLCLQVHKTEHLQLIKSA